MSKPPVTQIPGRKQEVKKMFDTIAGHYDQLNHLLSFGIDRIWRRKLVKLLAKQQPQHILDLASGTGDLAIAAAKANPRSIIGTDIAENMLAIGREKIAKVGLSDIITLQPADSENLPFADNTFDAATVGFGVRNYENLPKGIAEMCRVLKTGGYAYILEFSKPKRFPVKQAYQCYFNCFLPVIGRLVSKHDTAYTYLPESVSAFPEDGKFVDILRQAGFSYAEYKALSYGITNLYIAKK